MNLIIVQEETFEDHINGTTLDLSDGVKADSEGNASFVIKTKTGKPLPSGWRLDPLVIFRGEDVGMLFCSIKLPRPFVY
jgi:hypothetical protein